MRVSLLASGAGAQPSSSSFAKTKGSMDVRVHAAFWVSGTSTSLGGVNDQCGSYSAPCSTHRVRSAISSSESWRLLFGGGIWTSGSLEVMRRTSWLCPGLPGTTACPPDVKAAKAPSSVSRRRSPSRAASSGPWQAKQRSERMGLTWKLKSTVSGSPSTSGTSGCDWHAGSVTASASSPSAPRR